VAVAGAGTALGPASVLQPLWAPGGGDPLPPASVPTAGGVLLVMNGTNFGPPVFNTSVAANTGSFALSATQHWRYSHAERGSQCTPSPTIDYQQCRVNAA
jgi:hypothetical protein